MTEWRKDGMTEGRNDGRTEWQKGVTLYAPAILWRGHKNFSCYCVHKVKRDGHTDGHTHSLKPNHRQTATLLYPLKRCCEGMTRGPLGLTLRTCTKPEPQGALIAHLSTMSTSFKSSISKQMINQKAWLPYVWNQSKQQTIAIFQFRIRGCIPLLLLHSDRKKKSVENKTLNDL